MATPSVPQVNVTVKTLTSKDLEREEEEAKKRAGLKTTAFDVADSVEVKTSKAPATANAAEGQAPERNVTPHQRFQTARTTLIAALKKAGVVVKDDEANLVQKTAAALDDLDTLVARYVESGGNEVDLAKSEKLRDDIIAAAGAFEIVKAEVAEGTQTVQSASASAETNTAQTETGAESLEPLWASLEKDFATIGLTVDSREDDPALVMNKVTGQFNKALAKVKEKESELVARKTELETQLSTASGPEKTRIEAQLKALKVEIDGVVREKQNLQISYLRIHETLAYYQASSELGVPFFKTEKTATVRSSSATAPKAPKQGATVTTSSAGGPVPPNAGGATPYSGSTGGGGVTINTASAGGPSDASQTAGSGGTAYTTLGTASEGGAEPAPVTGDTPLVSAMNDFSGTTLAIASVGNNLKRDARRTEESIKKLLRAALSGNYEAIKTALIMLDKRASQIVIGMGTATIKAMQNYEKQMGDLSKSLEKLSTSDPSYNAKLAQVNSEMNMYSMNRQAIANFLRDTMSMREEIGNLTHGLISKDGQIGSALSRWG